MPVRQLKLSSSTIPSVIYANIGSISIEIDELRAIVSVNNPSLVCLTETWLSTNIPDSACDLSVFICFRNDRQLSQGGGVCVYVKASHPCSLIKDYLDSEIESIWLNIRPYRLPRGTSSILVATVYHPPSSSIEQNTLLISHL